MTGVQSIARAFSILRALAVGPAGVTDLSVRVLLPKSTVARLLSALESEGVVAQDTNGGEYRLGEGLVDLIGSVRRGRSLVSVARPFLTELANALGETSGISILDGDQVSYLDHVHLDSEVQVRGWTGVHAPIHVVPSGLVYLAHMDETELSPLLDGGLQPSTMHSTVDPIALRERLQQIRRAGYAWVYEEFVDGINSVAAPLFDGAGNVVAAIHVHGPAYRFPHPERTHDVGLQLVEAARDVAARLAEV